MNKVIRVPKELKVSRKIDRVAKDIQATEYAKSIERTRVSLHFEILRKSQINLQL